jgi:hypothetical protein
VLLDEVDDDVELLVLVDVLVEVVVVSSSSL